MRALDAILGEAIVAGRIVKVRLLDRGTPPLSRHVASSTHKNEQDKH
jgi:hypothetical protein